MTSLLYNNTLYSRMNFMDHLNSMPISEMLNVFKPGKWKLALTSNSFVMNKKSYAKNVYII